MVDAVYAIGDFPLADEFLSALALDVNRALAASITPIQPRPFGYFNRTRHDPITIENCTWPQVTDSKRDKTAERVGFELSNGSRNL
jgi:hypothetical protein